MRLYLSSFDLGSRPDELVALAGENMRTAIIVNALDNFPEARSDWLTKQTEKLSMLGFDVFELDLRDYFGASAELGTLLQNVGVVWISGGNSFILRRAMRQSGFDLLITSSLARDEIVYAGFSAAAVITAASLRGLEIVDNPESVPLGYDAEIVWDGLGLLPYSIAVHFKSNHSESELIDRAIAFYEECGISYRTLRDGEALVINGDGQQIVGTPTSA